MRRRILIFTASLAVVVVGVWIFTHVVPHIREARLIRVIEEGDEDQVQAAIRKLAAMGSERAVLHFLDEAVEPVLEGTGLSRRIIQETLVGEMGDRALPALRHAIHNPKVQVRQDAVYIGSCIKGSSVEVLAFLTGALADSEDGVRTAALQSIAAVVCESKEPWEPASVLPAVLECVKDMNPSIRSSSRRSTTRRPTCGTGQPSPWRERCQFQGPFRTIDRLTQRSAP